MSDPSAHARLRSQAVRLTAVPLLAAAFLAGCGSDEDDATQTAYCVNAQDEVVDNENCDEGRSGGGAFFVFFGGSALRGGPIGRGSVLRGGERVSTLDRARIADRGGFGGGARTSGVGRSVSARGAGGGFSGGG